MFVSETRIHVRYAETDRMGIVHHSNYAVWFEEARTEFLNALGYSYAQIEDEGILLPLTDLKCSFKKPAQYEEDIIVRTRISRATCVRIQFVYEVLDVNDGSLIATGQTDHAWTDAALVPVNIMKRLPDIYAVLCRCIE
ncbi:MAG: acyl-CoA thioesterase [Bacillota bacterium]